MANKGMKAKTLLILLLAPVIGYCQSNFLSEYREAERLLQTNKIDSAFFKFQYLEKNVSTKIPCMIILCGTK